ncbi:Alpha/Beta hydrolase protein [Limtongia smithiae]|uniref:Alpha/Beta hydrolase protein n=1 Tax=Limtongia smithiae TaxID=1125753 RepID=UPI0034CDE2B4
MAEHTIEYDHPLLGHLIGVLVENGTIAQFRGIKFADVPGRFRQSVVMDKLVKSDFTTYGPACMQPDLVKYHQTPSFGGRIEPTDFGYSELDCLNLTLTVPASLLTKPGQTVPILTWIHGGAYRMGFGAVSGIENGRGLVSRSIAIGKPVIVINIQYRLNVFGFLASEEIKAYNKSHGEPFGNFYFYDLRNGLAWIKKFAPGFGGDIEEITAFGESAGAIAVSQLIVGAGASENPPFKRAILESGFASLLGPEPISFHETIYDLIVKNFVGEIQPGESKLEKLLALPAEGFIDFDLLPQVFFPVVDGELFSERLVLDKAIEITAKQDWLESFLVGDCANEGVLFAHEYAPDKMERMTEMIERSYSSDVMGKIPKILEDFKVPSLITGTAVATEELANYTYMVGSIMFNAQVYAAARDPNKAGTGKKKAYLYHFDKANILFSEKENRVFGYCNHALDVLYVFSNLVKLMQSQPSIKDDPVLVKREATVSDSLATKWIEYGYGIKPWDQAKVGVIAADGDGTWEVMTEEEDIEKNGRHVKEWLTILS